jgi:nicotinamidase-related amidase
MTGVTNQKNGTAMVVLDLTRYIVANYSSDEHVVARAAEALDAARGAGLPVYHVVPESMRGDIHDLVAPVDSERVLGKTTVGAFGTTKLHDLLDAQGIGRVVLAGVATSGTILSTTRWAFDIGYQVIVCRDACADPDPEVHEALVDETRFAQSWLGLWRLATVVPTAAVDWSDLSPAG